MYTTYKPVKGPDQHCRGMTLPTETLPTKTFPTKIGVLLRDDLAVWQRLNVTAFVVSGVAGTHPQLLGEDYVDADGTGYLPMLGQPVMIFEGDAETLTKVHQRAIERGVA